MLENSHECRSCNCIVGLDRIRRRVLQGLELRFVDKLELVGHNVVELWWQAGEQQLEQRATSQHLQLQSIQRMQRTEKKM